MERDGRRFLTVGGFANGIATQTMIYYKFQNPGASPLLVRRYRFTRSSIDLDNGELSYRLNEMCPG